MCEYFIYWIYQIEKKIINPPKSNKVILKFVLLTKLINHIQILRVFCLLFVRVESFYVFWKLYWTVNLDLFVCWRDWRRLLHGLWCVECGFQLFVCHFVDNSKTVFESGHNSIGSTWILISKSASLSYMAFE